MDFHFRVRCRNREMTGNQPGSTKRKSAKPQRPPSSRLRRCWGSTDTGSFATLSSSLETSARNPAEELADVAKDPVPIDPPHRRSLELGGDRGSRSGSTNNLKRKPPRTNNLKRKPPASMPLEFKVETVLGIDRYGIFCRVVGCFGEITRGSLHRARQCGKRPRIDRSPAPSRP